MNLPVLIPTAVLIVAAGLWIWRDRLRRRPVPAALRPGNPLPAFAARDERGNRVRSTDLRGAPAVLLLVRGNWCPFCTRQVEDLTAHYKTISELGARLILITPKPLQTTRRVAEIFGVDFDFWLDEDLAIAHSLGLYLESGVPAKYREDYGSDTVWPASLVIDADGIIRYAAVSRFVADRPNAASLVSQLQKLDRTAH